MAVAAKCGQAGRRRFLETQGEPTLGFNLVAICQRQDVELGKGGRIRSTDAGESLNMFQGTSRESEPGTCGQGLTSPEAKAVPESYRRAVTLV